MTHERLRQILEQTVAASFTEEQLLPTRPPAFVTVQRNHLVTVIPAKEWTELVFAINELTSNTDTSSD